METCVLCGNKTGLFAKKSYNGRLCNDCLSLIPSNIQLSSADADYLKTVVEKTVKKKKKFDCTAFYGSLFLDGVHNMFCISKRQQNGQPLRFGDTYCVTELKEVGLYCTNVRNIGARYPKIICDVKIKVTTEDKFAEYLIIGGEKCTFETIEGGVEWQEPAKLSMFRSLFNQMIENEVFSAYRKLEAIKEMEREASEIKRSERWARGIFFFREDDEITDEVLKKRRNMLVKLFHPDIGSASANDVIMTQINEAYQSLSSFSMK